MQVIWNDFLNIIKQEAGVQVVETWFKAVRLERWDKETDTAYLLMPNPFVKKWIQEHYISLIKTHLERLLHSNSIRLFLFCKTEDDQPQESAIPVQQHNFVPSTVVSTQSPPSIRQDKPSPPSGRMIMPARYDRAQVLTTSSRSDKALRLNPNYTFDTLVVGPSNSLAHAAAVAVSQNLGKVYNPLFIYGQTGLGKTHLLHAIGNEVKSKNKMAVVMYKTSDSFMNEFVQSIKMDRIRNFRNKYQKVDLLLLDDIQFFSNKEQTQETFFHIFDCLQGRNKQVIFSSDTLPKDIKGLQSRLKSRLQSGLVADIHEPTLEMKMAILNKKMQYQLIECDEEVTRFIASQNVSSVRELEGYLMRLSAFASLSGQPVSLDIAKQVLGQVSQATPEDSSLDKVISTVAKCCDVSVSDIKSKNKNKKIALARQIAFYISKKATPNSFQVIGNFMGGRKHTTVMHAVTKIETLKNSDKYIANKLHSINESLQV